MAAILTVYIVLVVSLLISRIATVALALTGMSKESARFQARSALSGVGFTTSEAEDVVSHPVRRRIVQTLMLLGGAGVVTAVASLILSFAGTTTSEAQTRLALLAAGLLVLLLAASSGPVDRWLSWTIAAGLRRWTDLEDRDYAALLHLAGGFGVSELNVGAKDWVANRTLEELALRSEGVAVLGIERPNRPYNAAPDWSTEVKPGDTLILYGPTTRICEIDRRPHGPEGDRAHEEAVAAHRAGRDRDPRPA